MCGRFTNTMTWAEIHALYNIHDNSPPPSNMPPRYNGAPGQELLVIRRNHANGEIVISPLRWGLIPRGWREGSGGPKPINARAEIRRRCAAASIMR